MFCEVLLQVYTQSYYNYMLAVVKFFYGYMPSAMKF